MKALYAMFAVVLMGTSINAMAQDGADRVMNQMNDQLAVAMEQRQDQHEQQTAVVSNQVDHGQTNQDQHKAPAHINEPKS